MKNRRIITLLSMFTLLAGCSETKLPKLKKMDLSDAIALFCAVPYENDEIRYRRTSSGGLSHDEFNEKANFYKIDKNGVASIVNFQTKKSENDKEILQSIWSAEIFDINDEYFYFSPRFREDDYLVNKETGEAVFLKDSSARFYGFGSYDAPYYKCALPKDSKGNIYTASLGNNYKTKMNGQDITLCGYAVGKLSINNGKYEEKAIYKNENLYPFSASMIAADKDGNVAVKTFPFDENVLPKEVYITNDGNVIDIKTEEYFKEEDYYHSTKHYFQGYDGEIYTNEKNNICRIIPLKNNDGKIIDISQSPLFELPSYAFEAFDNENNLLYIDETKTIVLAVNHDNYLEFYSIYGNQAGQKILSYEKDDETNKYNMYYRSKDSLYSVWDGKILRFKFLNEPTVQSVTIADLSGYNKVTRDNKIIYEFYDRGIVDKRILRYIGFYDFESNETKMVENIKFDYISDHNTHFVAL